MNDDTYINKLNNLPPGYESCNEMPCPKCGESAVYGEFVEDQDWDVDGVHAILHGSFVCVNCNYKFTK